MKIFIAYRSSDIAFRNATQYLLLSSRCVTVFDVFSSLYKNSISMSPPASSHQTFSFENHIPRMSKSMNFSSELKNSQTCFSNALKSKLGTNRISNVALNETGTTFIRTPPFKIVKFTQFTSPSARS